MLLFVVDVTVRWFARLALEISISIYAVKAQVGSTSVSIIILIMDSHLANSSSGEEDSSEEESSSEAEGKTKARIDREIAGCGGH